MSSMGLHEFFALEAAEYLDRLDEIAGQDRTPSQDFVRYARALRGAALMADQEKTALAARAFEQMAKSVTQGESPWDDEVRALTVRALDDFRILVRNAGSWSDDDESRVKALSESLQSFVGGESKPAEITGGDELDPGAREFVAKEGALIAEALEKAAEQLASDPTNFAPIDEAMQTMQALRGLGALQDLQPLPSILDGIESSLADLAAGAIDDPAALFGAAARAVGRAAEEIGATGAPSPESADAKEFASRLGHRDEPSPDVLPVEALYYDDDGPHVLEHGAVTSTASASLTALQIVSHGEYLSAAAEDFERAHSVTQRELLAHTLGSALRSLGAARGGELPTAIASFALAARDCIGRGLAVEEPAAFAAQLRAAGAVMSRASEEAEASLAEQLRASAAAVSRIRQDAVQVAPAEPAPTSPAEASPLVTTVSSLEEFSIPDGSVMEREAGLVGGWATYVRLLVENARRPAGLISELLTEDLMAAGAPVPPGTAPSLEPVAAARVEPTPAPEPVAAAAKLVLDPAPSSPEIGTGEIVPIERLLYDGRAALHRVKELRQELQRAREPKRRELLDEIFDLVDLALAQ